jgi:hypothetical protein
MDVLAVKDLGMSNVSLSAMGKYEISGHGRMINNAKLGKRKRPHSLGKRIE